MTAAILINKTELGQWTWPSLLLTLGFSLQAWPLTTVCGGPELQFIIYVYNAKQKLSAARICSRSIGTIILSPLFLHGVSTEHQLWWQNKHFQVPHTSHKVDGGLVAKLCPALATPWTPCPPSSFVHGISQARILSGLPFPSLQDLLNPGASQPWFLHCRQILYREPPGKSII